MPPTRGAAFWDTLAALVFCCFAAGAFVTFFSACLAFLASLATLMAWSRWALRTSGFMLRLAMMSVMEAPTMARWNFWVRRERFLVASSTMPFLCFLLYSTVHFTLRGLRFIRKERSHFLLMKVKVLPSALTSVLPLAG